MVSNAEWVSLLWRYRGLEVGQRRPINLYCVELWYIVGMETSVLKERQSYRLLQSGRDGHIGKTRSYFETGTLYAFWYKDGLEKSGIFGFNEGDLQSNLVCKENPL